MKITFLGYTDMDYYNANKEHIDGLKVHYYFKSMQINHFGFKSDTNFVARQNAELITAIKSIKPNTICDADFIMEGRSKYLSSIMPEK